MSIWTSLGKCPPRMTCSGGQPLEHVLAALCDVPFFPTQISGGPRNRQYHQLSLGQAPHDAKGIHHLHQINPGRSLVGICYIPAVDKGLRTYRFRRPSPVNFTRHSGLPRNGIDPGTGATFDFIRLIKAVLSSAPSSAFSHSADQNGMLGDAG